MLKTIAVYSTAAVCASSVVGPVFLERDDW